MGNKVALKRICNKVCLSQRRKLRDASVWRCPRTCLFCSFRMKPRKVMTLLTEIMNYNFRILFSKSQKKKGFRIFVVFPYFLEVHHEKNAPALIFFLTPDPDPPLEQTITLR